MHAWHDFKFECTQLYFYRQNSNLGQISLYDNFDFFYFDSDMYDLQENIVMLADHALLSPFTG